MKIKTEPLEQSLSERAEYYLAKVQQVGKLGFWELDIETQKAWWSDEVYRMFGIDPKNGPMTPETYLSYIHPEDRDRLLAARATSMANRTGYSMNIRLQKADGSIAFTLIHAHAEVGENNKVSRMFGIIQDISDRVQQERDLTEQRMRASAQGHLAAIGEMASGIAHEINNPLAIIIGKIGRARRVIQVKPLDEATILQELTSIETASLRIAKIIGSLRSITGPGVSQDGYSELDFDEVLNSTIALCQEKLKSDGVSFTSDLQAGIVVKGNHAELVQVILTLLYNAHDAVVNTASPWIRLDVFQLEGSDVTLRVTDSGKGIPDNIAQKLMTPFFTTKPVGKGVGLGLSLARKIIEEHGGILSLNNTLGNTCFEIRLPQVNVGLLVPLSVEEAIEAHLNWKQRLLNYSTKPDGTLKPESISRDDQCALGKWIYHPRNEYAGQELFQKLKEKHREFHLETSQLVARINNGEILSADLVFDSASHYIKLSNEVIQLLLALKSKSGP